MRYFFHLMSRGRVFEDTMGDHFSTIEEALAHAHVVADDLGREGGHEREQAVIVANSEGQEIAVVPVRREGLASTENPEPG